MTNVSIRTCPPKKHREALELVLAKVSPEQRGSVIESLRPVAESGLDIFAGLAIAETGSQMLGASWLQPQIGRTATLWPPVLTDGADPGLARLLAEHSLQAAAGLSAVLAQTLLDDADDSFANDLPALGFTHLADLKYLMLTVAGRSPEESAEVQLASPAMEYGQQFFSLVEETYQGTLDCPGLEGQRDIHDVLAGYKTVGTYDPSLWFVVNTGSQPAGVLLLAPYPDANQWELVYMGIAPRFRGRGLGKQVLSEVCRRAAFAKVKHVVLAVDAANHPALRMYEEAGFVEWTRRTAFIKTIVTNHAD